jgi:hypothetical protein
MGKLLENEEMPDLEGAPGLANEKEGMSAARLPHHFISPLEALGRAHH